VIEAPAPAPDIKTAIEGLTDRTIAARVVTNMVRIGQVSTLAAVADRIKAKKEAYQKKADEWAKRLDALDAREPEAFKAGEQGIETQETDLSDMESMMRTLSNLPNG